jgi:hypothetical protein
MEIGESVAIALAIGWTMLFAGTRKRMLVRRTRRRRCPACGVLIEGRVCGRH